MHEVLVNRLGGLSLPRKRVVRLTDRPDMILDVYRGRKTTIQQQQQFPSQVAQAKYAIYVTTPNLARQTRVSVFKFFSVSDPQKIKRRKETLKH